MFSSGDRLLYAIVSRENLEEFAASTSIDNKDLDYVITSHTQDLSEPEITIACRMYFE